MLSLTAQAERSNRKRGPAYKEGHASKGNDPRAGGEALHDLDINPAREADDTDCKGGCGNLQEPTRPAGPASIRLEEDERDCEQGKGMKGVVKLAGIENADGDSKGRCIGQRVGA